MEIWSNKAKENLRAKKNTQDLLGGVANYTTNHNCIISGWYISKYTQMLGKSSSFMPLEEIISLPERVPVHIYWLPCTVYDG